MITETERKRIIDLIHQEVVPAIGCTEPIAVTYVSALVRETLGQPPKKRKVCVSISIKKWKMCCGAHHGRYAGHRRSSGGRSYRWAGGKAG